MKDKLKLEDCCLTIEQAKELKELGVDFGETIFAYCNYVNPNNAHFGYELVHFYKELKADLIPTITNTEMLEMLPNHVSYCRDEHGWYNIEYKKICCAPEFTYIGALLRDALFKMIKYLKTNKLM